MATMNVISNPTPVRRNTYEILRLSRTVLLVLAGLLAVAICAGAHVHRDAMQTIGRDAVPSILAAQHIKAALADMDADQVNVLIAPPNTANAATDGVMKRRVEAEEALLAAAGNITYEAEREPIKTLEITGGVYNRLAQQAEDYHDASNPDDVRYYRAGVFIMDGKLLPAADALDRANNDELQHTYRTQASDSSIATGCVVLAALLLLAALAAMQLFLNSRMRRTLNPPLLLATIAVLGLSLYALGAMFTEQSQLKIAKEDSFESVHALWQARAVAYQSNAEESRYLLDPAHADEYEQAFERQSRLLVTLPAGMSFEQLLAHARRGDHVSGFTGYLADELNNITFKGEREAALKTLEAYGVYLQIDAQLRALERAGQHQRAVDLCIGSADGQSDWAFERFDRALGETLRINQEQLTKAVDAGLSPLGELGVPLKAEKLLSTLELKALLVSALIAVLIVLGYAPRMREYE